IGRDRILLDVWPHRRAPVVPTNIASSDGDGRGQSAPHPMRLEGLLNVDLGSRAPSRGRLARQPRPDATGRTLVAGSRGRGRTNVSRLRSRSSSAEACRDLRTHQRRPNWLELIPPRSPALARIARSPFRPRQAGLPWSTDTKEFRRHHGESVPTCAL